MADQYSPKNFLRNVPNALLQRYFEEKQIAPAIDWENLDEGKKGADALFEATATLSEEQQAAIEIDFQNINALACEGGIQALVNEALFEENDAFQEGMFTIDGLHAKAMWAFLEEPDYWRAASLLLHAENISYANWRKIANLPDVPPNVDTKDIDEFEKAIGSYFFNKNRKGRRCTVEVYRHVESGKEYFFAYPEDYGLLTMEWMKDQLKPRAIHPAFEIIFVYSQKDHFLDIYAPKNYDAVEELRGIFAKAILKLNVLPDGTIDKQTYDLSALADPNFEFKFDPIKTGIEDIVVTELRLSLKHGKGKKITLNADTKHNRQAVYDLLRELKLPPYSISRALLKVIYSNEQGKKISPKQVRITFPNNCNLNHDGKDGTLRDILKASNLEKHLPTDDEPQ